MTSTNRTLRVPIRETFGIIDPKTGRKYEDIVSSSLVNTSFNYAHLLTATLFHYGKLYRLHMDSTLKRELRESMEPVLVIISFQERLTGNIALARVKNQEIKEILK